MAKRKYKTDHRIAYVVHGHKTINETLFPIISFLHRDCFERVYNNPRWHVYERVCNGISQGCRAFRTRQEALDWMRAFGEVKFSK